MTTEKLSPFIKWAGGKRQLLPQINERIPDKFNNYYEPFIGGGAVLFELKPRRATINDINKALITTYVAIREEPQKFVSMLREIDDSMWEDGKEYFYEIRGRFNNKILKNEYDTELASLLVFLNKHCFNGLYRVNSKGLFNVPYNNSRRPSFDEEHIYSVSNYLKDVEILNLDFEDACLGASEGDFVFLDSPYAPIKPESFHSYTKEGFDIESHRRLSRLYDELSARGCYCMLTNHNTELINELYSGKGYKLEVVDVKRMINSDPNNRIGKEIIICNY